ncbi:MAG TPA: hypothetical protein VGS27_05255 [Candidatus Sulfotelmatobacter sp.]|nr:hypothetical protein [Candidatus Sulfotelmatobacter sp.]
MSATQSLGHPPFPKWDKENGSVPSVPVFQNSIDDPVTSAVISPDGRQLAYTDQSEGLVLLQIDTGEKRRFANTGLENVVAWYPDGTHLLVQTSAFHGLFRQSTVDGSTRTVLDATFIVANAAVSPDGARIAWIGGTGKDASKVWVMDADGESAHPILSGDSPEGIIGVDWSPTSRRIVLSSVDRQGTLGTLRTCDPEGHDCAVVLSDAKLTSINNGVTDVVWSADGRAIYKLRGSGANKENVWAIPLDSDTGRVKGPASQITNWAGYYMNGLSTAHDRRRLAFERQRVSDEIRLLDLRKPSQTVATSRGLGGDNWSKWSGVWTPDGSSLIYLSNPQQRWGIFRQDLRTKEISALITGPGNYDEPVISPDGKWLVFSKLAPKDSPKQIMRMLLNGGSPTVVLAGDISVQCAVTANVCVMVEQVKDGQELYRFDPVEGRGSHITQIKGLFTWSLSFDGRKIAMQSDSALDRIEILDLQTGSKSGIELKNRSFGVASWAPDNQHIYGSGEFDNKFQISCVGPKGEMKNIISVPVLAFIADPRPSPDGRYLEFRLRRYDSNVVMLENF